MQSSNGVSKLFAQTYQFSLFVLTFTELRDVPHYLEKDLEDQGGK